MATSTPGPSPVFPTGQKREQFGRDWGNYASLVTLPNGSGNVLTATEFRLEAGDRAYLVVSGTSGLEYLCVSAGTAGGGDAVWAVNTGGRGPWSSVLYVDIVRGNDTTGTRGNENLPFATIQAALNAMLTFDVVELAPQIFQITTPLLIPASVVDCTIVGSMPTGYTPFASFSGSVGGTLILSLAGDVFDLGTNLGLASFSAGNFAMFSVAAAISANGSAYAKDAFLASGLTLSNCNIVGGTITTKYVGSFFAVGCTITGSAISHTSGGAVMYRNCYGTGLANSPSLLAAYDATDALATTTKQTVALTQGTIIGGVGAPAFVTLSGQCSLVVDQSSMIGGLKGSSLSVNGAKAPSILCSGYIGAANTGVVDFSSAGAELPDTATVLTWNFKGTRLYGNNGTNNNGPSIVRFKVGGAAGSFQTVVLDASVATPLVTFTADAKIHLTMRGADVPQPVYTTPGADGDIVPPMLTGTIDISAGGAVAKTWVQLGYAGLIRTGAAPDTAFITSSGATADAFIGPAGKTTTGLTISSTISAGNTAANWMAVWK